MIASGLMIVGEYGLLAGYVGWSAIEESLHEWDSKKDQMGDEIYKKSEGRLQWAVFPVLCAENIPVLGSFINLLSGFIRMDKLSMNRDSFTPSYKANVIFRSIPIGNYGELTLNSYTLSNWYNINTKYNLHAGSLGLTFHFGLGSVDRTQIVVEGGRREYFDTELNHDRYTDGIYSKIALKFLFEDTNDYAALYLESGSRPYFENPIIGVLFTSDWIFKKMYLSFSLEKKELTAFNFGFTIAAF